MRGLPLSLLRTGLMAAIFVVCHRLALGFVTPSFVGRSCGHSCRTRSVSLLMGAATAQDVEEAVGRVQAFQFQHNFWPEPIREAGTTHASNEHEDLLQDGATAELFGTNNNNGHTFDTMVAAIDATEAPKARLFLYGIAQFGDNNEQRPEILCLGLNDEGSAAESMLRYTDYFASADTERLVNASSLANTKLQAANRLRAELTSAPTDPNNDDRKVRMKEALHKLLDTWFGTGDDKEEEDTLEQAVAKVCTPDGTISFPLQQTVVQAKDLPQQWSARTSGLPFGHFGQTEVKITSEAYAGHHPTGFAQIVLSSLQESTGRHLTSNGVLVAEFDTEGNQMEKVIVMREFLSEAERQSILV